MEQVKKSPTLAQIKQRHKFMLTGTLAGMQSRLTQLISDNTIPQGEFKMALIRARILIVLSSSYLKELKLEVK